MRERETFVVPVEHLELAVSGVTAAIPASRKNIALFLSADSFEKFFGGMFHLDREAYLQNYRNDFAWDYGIGLRDQGHRVLIYILSYGKPEIREIDSGISVRFLQLPRWLKGIDPILYRMGRFKFSRYWREQVRFRAYRKSLNDALGLDAVDVLYHQEFLTLRFDVVAPKVQVPLVGADHGARITSFDEQKKRQALSSAAFVTCQTEENYLLAQRMGAQAVLLRNGVDTNFFSPPANSNGRSKTVLAVGRMVNDQKRFSDLISMMVQLPEFTLALVGSGPDQKMLEALAVDLHVKDRVEFVGFVADRHRLRELYRTCGVFVSTSQWEAVALVLLEAMSCCAPVVATNIESFSELIVHGENGLLYPVGDVAAGVAAIREAYANGAKLGLGARETTMSKHSDKATYASLSELIETLPRSIQPASL